MRPNVVAIRSIRLGKECIPTSGEPFSAGIHPWDCETVGSEWLDSLETLLPDLMHKLSPFARFYTFVNGVFDVTVEAHGCRLYRCRVVDQTEK